MTKKHMFYITVAVSIIFFLVSLVSFGSVLYAIISAAFIWLIYFSGGSLIWNALDGDLLKKNESVIHNEEEHVNYLKKKLYTGVLIKYLREKENISREQLGEMLGGYSEDYITKVEDGNINIDNNMVVQLSQIFDLPEEKFKENGSRRFD